ncbi:MULTISPECIES: TetR/AcrR family transcriptional regulator [unclassified Carboxylicivirga]|uniref:TetR/AcrR family transcriptional regulator n=1 Tax=Carboxylicivirga TaxID=1628153 RepID=UPI003D334F9B
MKSRNTHNKWLEAGYRAFAEYGPDFSLKALAEKTQLPRATFYYHFDDKDHLLTALLKHHEYQINSYHNTLRKEVTTLIPDLYRIMYRYKTSVLFHQQLFRHCEIETYYHLYSDTNETSIRLLLPLIKAHFETDKPDMEIIQFYKILTDVWYIRLNTSQLSVESMINLATEIMENTLGLCSIYTTTAACSTTSE